MGWIPLPEGSNVADTVRRLRAIDAEFFGSIYAKAGVIGGDVTIQGTLTGGDYVSSAWDGGSDLSGGADGTATAGFFLDDSAGAAQMMGPLYLGDSLQIDSERIYFGDTQQAYLYWDSINSYVSLNAEDLQLGQIGGSYVYINGNGGIRLRPDDSTIDIEAERWNGIYDRISTSGSDSAAAEPYFGHQWTSETYDGVEDTEEGTYETKWNVEVNYHSVDSGAGPYYVQLFKGDIFTTMDIEPMVSSTGYDPTYAIEIGNSTYDGTITALADQFLFQAGSASAPGISFESDNNTGWFWDTADQISLALGGGRRARFSYDSGTGESRLHLGGETNDWIAYDAGDEYFAIQRQGNEVMRLATAPLGGNMISFGTTHYTGSPSGLMVTSGNAYTALQAYRKTTTGANYIQQWKSDKTATVSTHAYVEADGDFYNTNGTYGTISDERLKENIVTAPSYWDKFKQVRFTNYNLKADKGKTKLLNVVAQELEQIFPNLVKENEDKFKTVKNSVLYGPVAGSVLQEAMNRIEALEKKVKECNCST